MTSEVTQADRDAALPFIATDFRPGDTYSTGYYVRRGERDDHPLVQAFARHRIESTRAGGGEGEDLDNKPVGGDFALRAFNVVRCLAKAEFRSEIDRCKDEAEYLMASLKDDSLPSYLRIRFPEMEAARLTAQSGEGRAAIIEECARIADGWNPGRKDRVTETGIAAAIRELLGFTRDDVSPPTQRMAETLGARFVMSGEGRSGAGEDMLRTARDLRENANGDPSAIQQAIAWERRAAALRATDNAGA